MFVLKKNEKKEEDRKGGERKEIRKEKIILMINQTIKLRLTLFFL